MEKRSRDGEVTRQSKKVCFVPDDQVLDYIDGNTDRAEDDDLDLDTLETRKSNRRVKKDVYSDEEDMGDYQDLEDDQVADDNNVIKSPQIDSSSGEESDPDEHNDNDVKVIPFNMKADREEG